jgi:hypothetical protein
MKLSVSLQLLDLGQSVGLLGRAISLSQCDNILVYGIIYNIYKKFASPGLEHQIMPYFEKKKFFSIHGACLDAEPGRNTWLTASATVQFSRITMLVTLDYILPDVGRVYAGKNCCLGSPSTCRTVTVHDTVQSHFMRGMRSWRSCIIQDKFSRTNKYIAGCLGLALFQTLRMKWDVINIVTCMSVAIDGF